MAIAEQMRECLTRAFRPSRIEVIDDSEKHRGHAGYRGEGGESHFTIVLRADELASMSRLERHRAVHCALGDLATRVHALALDLG